MSSLHAALLSALPFALQVAGSTYQVLHAPNNRTYIGSGKVTEVARAVRALNAETVIFDDELSPGQVRVHLKGQSMCLPPPSLDLLLCCSPGTRLSSAPLPAT